jgi:hypothetical protein
MRERLESIVDRWPPEDSGIAAQVVLPAPRSWARP